MNCATPDFCLLTRTRGRPSGCRVWRGFTLIELLLVIIIIVLLLSILLPTISRARELSLRTQCASNLRQCGMVEAMYSNENDGWLLLRNTDHAGTINSLAPVGSFYSRGLSDYCSPLIWFCPEYNGVNLPVADLWSNAARTTYVSMNRTGYGFFGACWNGTTAVPAAPRWGSIWEYTNPAAGKASQLRSYMVRMTEWYADNGTDWGVNGASKWHLGRNHTPEGGNLLYADGSVAWSRNIFTFFAGEKYVVPEGYPNVP